MSEPTIERLAEDLRGEIRDAQASYAQYLSDLEASVAERQGAFGTDESGAATTDPVLALLTETTAPEPERLELLRRLSATLSRRDDYVEALLAVLRDRDDATPVRAAALRVLMSAAFQVGRFVSHQRAYRDALHDLVSDPVAELRERAVSILAQQHDPVVREVLQAGLRGDAPLPVERELAIRLLAEDDHLDNLPWLQELYRSDSAAARQEAVRFLGSYAEASPLLETILRDRDESAEVRRQSAASLRYVARDAFNAVAKEIAVDPADDPDVRSAALAALRLGSPSRVLDDSRFLEQVESIAQEEPASQVTEAARELLERRGEPE
jgi:hypothetical protein